MIIFTSNGIHYKGTVEKLGTDLIIAKMEQLHTCYSENGFVYTSNTSLAVNCGSCEEKRCCKTPILEFLDILFCLFSFTIYYSY